MQTTAPRLLIAGFVMAGSLLPLAPGSAKDKDAPPGAFPRIKGKLLSGGSFDTDQLRGKPHLVVIGFERAHSGDMRAWAQEFRKSFPDPAKADYFEIAALPGQIGLMRGFIDRQMVKNSPPEQRGHIMTVYAADSVCKELGIKDRKVVYVFVLDGAGKVTHREQGSLSPEAFGRVKERLSSALSQATSIP